MGAKPPCCPQGLGWYRAIARFQPSIKYCAILQLRNVKMERIVKIRLWSCIIGYLTFTEVSLSKGQSCLTVNSLGKVKYNVKCVNEVQLHIKRGQKQKFWTMNSHRRAKMINKQQQQDCRGQTKCLLHLMVFWTTWWEWMISLKFAQICRTLV